MNAFLLALVSFIMVASTVQGANTASWAGNIELQISKEGAYSGCTDRAMTAFTTQVTEWVKDELIDLFGESAFTLADVHVADTAASADKLVLSTAIDCLECSKVADKKAIARIIKFFAQHMLDAWIEENDTTLLGGCLGEDTTVTNVFIGESKVTA